MSMSDAQREGAAAASLVARAKAGDARAFEELVRRYRHRIVALALHLTGSASEAEDIAQDVFLSAFRALDSFEGRSEFFTWVYRMAVNRSLNKRRDKARRGEEPLDDPRVELAVEIDAAGDPRRAAELRRTYARLLRGLDSLPPEMRTTVVLVSLQGMSHGEVAVVQRCSEGTIAWRMHEARRRLHEMMAPDRVTRRRAGLSAHLEDLLLEVGLPVPEPN
ncbi:MAG: sigma-70 family RNA polymerase sigma factor [Kofleriaceae bacterium]|nr:sigma-70 family RNA polymerase sigma factor [Myxococcales bacterium]MCB9564369.1 sigma-70 family RNA polymerase sigma factor [Kofleriaceae bacterium]